MAKAATPPVNRFGLTDSKVQKLIDDGRRRARLNLIQTAQNTSPTEKAAAVGGFGLGNAIADMISRVAGPRTGDPRTLAEEISSAQRRARSVLQSTPEEMRDRGSFSGPIQERKILIAELDAADLPEQSNIVRQQIIDLAVQQQEFRKAEGDNTKMSIEIKEMQEQARVDALEGHASDQLTRHLSEIEQLDVSTPEGERRFDSLEKMITKLTAPTPGKTEFDEPFDKVTVRNVDKSLQETVGALDGFLQAELEFKPEYLTMGSKLKSWAYSMAETAGFGLDAEETQNLKDFARFRQITSASLNAYIKQVTGAQMSAAEAERLKQDVPNKEDSPSQYLAKLERVIENLSARRDRSLFALEAHDDPSEFRKRISSPLTDFIQEATVKNVTRQVQLTGDALRAATRAAADRIAAGLQTPAPQG